MSAHSDVWDSVFNTPTAARNFDDGQMPWLLNPQTQNPDDDREVKTMIFTSSLLLAICELAGTASLRGWDLADPAARERLREHVQEIEQLVVTLKIGLREHEQEER